MKVKIHTSVIHNLYKKNKANQKTWEAILTNNLGFPIQLRLFFWEIEKYFYLKENSKSTSTRKFIYITLDVGDLNSWLNILYQRNFKNELKEYIERKLNKSYIY